MAKSAYTLWLTLRKWRFEFVIKAKLKIFGDFFFGDFFLHCFVVFAVIFFSSPFEKLAVHDFWRMDKCFRLSDFFKMLWV